jgi:hypothetical protein
VPGRGQRLQWPEAPAVAKPDIDIPAPRRERGVRKPAADVRDGIGVIGVIVREGDAAEAASSADLRREELEMLLECGSRVDQPDRIAAYQPRVGAVERKRARVVRADPEYRVAQELDPVRRGQPPSPPNTEKG